tara:strand:+ start:2102 stop:2278 length:177 start_codon:yes stop_codon:yes gene_type:complete
MASSNKEIMGEKEFFDKMKKFNQYLSMSERYKIAYLVEQMVEDIIDENEDDSKKIGML